MLWVLHQLDIMDKHRTVQVVDDVLPGPPPNVTISAVLGTGPTNLLGFFPGPFTEGDVLMWIAGGVTFPDDLEQRFRFQVRFPQGIAKGAELSALSKLYHFVSDEVLPQFERFF